MIKLLAFDLDGTLLNENQEIDTETLSEIKSHDDIKYMIVTGRNYGLTEGIVEKYDLNCDLILNNGHEFLSKDKSTHMVYGFAYEKLQKVAEILLKYDYHSSFHAGNGNKYTFHDIDSYYEEHLEMSSIVRNKDISELLQAPLFNREAYTKSTYKISNLDDFKTLEIMKIDAKNLDKEASEKAVAELSKIEGITLTTSFEAYLEICDSEMDKGKLLLQIAENYGIKPEEIAAFGDSNNDIEMIMAVPHSFAMENGKSELKAVAKHITDTNDNQGVLKGIRKILKEQGNV